MEKNYCGRIHYSLTVHIKANNKMLKMLRSRQTTVRASQHGNTKFDVPESVRTYATWNDACPKVTG